MDLSYAHEKLATGVSMLAIGSGRIHQRLIDAFTRAVMHAPMEGEPAELSAKIRDLHEDMTCEPAVADEGTIIATVRTMTEDQACEMARRIVELDFEVRAAIEDQRIERRSRQLDR